MIEVEDGATPAEQVVRIDSGWMQVELLALGAAIRTVRVPSASDGPGPVHLHLPNVADHADATRNPHLGASVGRYANRIAGASFPLDDRTVELVANSGPNQLHGGPDGFDRRVWDLLDTDGADDGGAALFRLVSPDGDQGFPGDLTAQALYEVSGDELSITYTATCDAPTVVNLTNHGYWNLDGAATGDPEAGTVAGQLLEIAADRYLPVGPDGIPTGGLVDVSGTPFDLRRPRELGPTMEAVGGGLDHCFEVRGESGTVRHAATLLAPRSGRWMSVSTDQVGVQAYTGNGLRPPFEPHGSVSLETQAFPDTPNRPDLGSVRLDPGHEYHSVTVLRFGIGVPEA